MVTMELTDAERLYLTLAVQHHMVASQLHGQALLQKLNPPQEGGKPPQQE